MNLYDLFDPRSTGTLTGDWTVLAVIGLTVIALAGLLIAGVLKNAKELGTCALILVCLSVPTAVGVGGVIGDMRWLADLSEVSERTARLHMAGKSMFAMAVLVAVAAVGFVVIGVLLLAGRVDKDFHYRNSFGCGLLAVAGVLYNEVLSAAERAYNLYYTSDFSVPLWAHWGMWAVPLALGSTAVGMFLIERFVQPGTLRAG